MSALYLYNMGSFPDSYYTKVDTVLPKVVSCLGCVKA